MKQYLYILSLLILIIACAGKEKSNPYGAAPDGEALYKKYCVLCHGVDGKLGLNGSKDITVTALTLDEISGVLAQGGPNAVPVSTGRCAAG